MAKRSSLRPWTLTAKLVAGTFAIVVLATLLSGALTVWALSGQLFSRLDGELRNAAYLVVAKSKNIYNSSDDFIAVPGLKAGTIGAIINGGSIQKISILVTDPNTQIVISTENIETKLELVKVGADPVGLDLGGELGDYRLFATPIGASGYLVIGLPLSELNNTLREQSWIVIMLATTVAAIAAVAGAALVQSTLRPLKRVAAAADQVAHMQLAKGAVEIPVRIAVADSEIHTEVGQVGNAFNLMISNVEQALTFREASEQQMRDFVADASHELRTPLASIRGYAELTKKQAKNLPEEVDYSVNRIHSEAIRMTDLVEELLLLTKLDANRGLQFAKVELVPILINAVSDAYVASPEHEWELDLAENASFQVYGDSAKLQQLLANLLANARIHTPCGTKVVVSVTQKNQTIALTVTDNGPGIPAGLQANLFSRFVRGDSSRSRKAGSTGLGLSIVQAIAQAHSGAVSVASVPGNTVFTVRLPVLTGNPVT